MGPASEALLDYAAYDARRAGFARLVLVLRPEQEAAFREHARRAFGRALDVRFVFQDLWDLPAGHQPGPGRRQPWGTAHAVLAAREAVGSRFAVCNADDYYGPHAFHLLAEHFRRTQEVGDPSFALVGFTLRETLSAAGGVARAVCRCDADGRLQSIVEIEAVRREGEGIAGVSVDGDPFLLTGEELVSMNLWAFRPPVFELLERQLRDFLRTSGGDPESEFRLSTAIGDLVARGAVRVRVLPARDAWCGVTFAADRREAERHLALQVAAGHYPVDLKTAFRGRGQ